MSMLSKGSQFDRALNQILSLKVIILLDSLKLHHDQDQSSHAQQKGCSKDPKIANAE
jgi:hypothetical protein